MVIAQIAAGEDANDHCIGNGKGNSCLVTGNGYGYAAVSPNSGALVMFLGHPYSHKQFDAEDPEGDGIETSNLIRRAAWVNNGVVVTGRPSYVSESQVIGNNSAALNNRFFMPFGLNRNALIATAQVNSSQLQPCLDMKWRGSIDSEESRVVDGTSIRVIKFTENPAPLVAIPLSSDSSSTSSCPYQGSGWAFMKVDNDGDIANAVRDLKKWQNGDSPNSLASREVHEMEQWRKPPVVCFASDDERRIYRQNETILRMAQIREPNTADRSSNGLINASLPTGEFVMPFPRDQAYATAALIETNHREEVKQAITALLNTGPGKMMKADVRGQDYIIPTARYFGDGGENPDLSNGKHRNLELDNWGLSLWSMGKYFEKYQDMDWLKASGRNGQNYRAARDKIVKPLLANTDSYGGGLIVAKDDSSWEQNSEDRRHYAFSTIAAIAGLKSFLPMAKAMGDAATVEMIQKKLALLQKGFNAAYVRGGQLRGSLEHSPKNDMDGALLEAINLGVVTDPKLIKSTMERMSLIKAKSGGYLRVAGGSDHYEQHEFLFINFALARVYLKQGRPDLAEALVSRMNEGATKDNNHIPEMLVSSLDKEFPGPVGSPTGAVPMVGYGAGVFDLYLAERQSTLNAKLAAGGHASSVCPASKAPVQLASPTEHSGTAK